MFFKMFLKISQISEENTFAEALLIIRDFNTGVFLRNL